MPIVFYAGLIVAGVLLALFFLGEYQDARDARAMRAAQDKRAWEDRTRAVFRQNWERARRPGLPPLELVREVIDRETSAATSPADELDDCA